MMHIATGTALDDQQIIGTEAAETKMEVKSQTSVAVVGILVTILIFLLLQTGAIAYWAGQQSSRQDTTQKQMDELKQKFEIIQAQYQVVTNKLAAIEAAGDRRK